jgi:hypothetical protein
MPLQWMQLQPTLLQLMQLTPLQLQLTLLQLQPTQQLLLVKLQTLRKKLRSNIRAF